MIPNLPSWIELLFLLTAVATIAIFHYANGRPKRLTALIVAWSAVHAGLAYAGFYQVTDTIPPRFALVLVPNTAFIIYGLTSRSLAWAAERRRPVWSTALHTVRIPVEIVLYYLFLHRMVPELMTFAGRNFDILAGLSAPVVAWLYSRQRIGKSILLVWNTVGLILVTFILVNGILSAELPFQQFGFEQPNRAVNYFPFVLLPATVVPIVFYTHLSDILLLRRAFRSGKDFS